MTKRPSKLDWYTSKLIAKYGFEDALAVADALMKRKRVSDDVMRNVQQLGSPDEQIGIPPDQQEGRVPFPPQKDTRRKPN